MEEHVAKRIAELVTRGNATVRAQPAKDYWIRDIVQGQSWMSSAANAIQQVSPPRSFFKAELDRLMSLDQLKGGIPIEIAEKVLGLLESVQREAQAGLLTRLEDQVVATAFDDFLDHASIYHKSGKVKEAAVLASAVLEDAVKRVATRSGVAAGGQSLDPLIDKLVKVDVVTAVKAKRLKSFAAIRNHALHAEWEKLDLKDVGAQISGIREFLDEHLAT